MTGIRPLQMSKNFLTKSEQIIWDMLQKNIGQTVTYETFQATVDSVGIIPEQIIRVHIYHLRKKLGPKVTIVSVARVGYYLEKFNTCPLCYQAITKPIESTQISKRGKANVSS